MAIEFRLWIFDGAWIDFWQILKCPFIIDGRGSDILHSDIFHLNIVKFFMEMELEAIYYKLGSIDDGGVGFLFIFRKGTLLVITLDDWWIPHGCIPVDNLIFFLFYFGFDWMLDRLFLWGLLTRWQCLSKLKNSLGFWRH